MNTSEQAQLAAAADTHHIPLPAYLVQAQELHEAATAYRLEVAALVEPDLYAVTAKTIAKTIDAALAFTQREPRLALATRVEAIAASAVSTAFDRFSEVLMTELAAPFDQLAAAFMTAHDNREPQNPEVVSALGALIAARDVIGPRNDPRLPASYDRATRTVVFANKEDLVNRSRARTAGLARGSEQWLTALLSLPGCRLRWQTPEQQIEQVRSLPADREGARVDPEGAVA